jgi:hypothetical protein
MFREIMAVYSENQMKLINDSAGKMLSCIFVKAGGTYTFLLLDLKSYYSTDFKRRLIWLEVNNCN